MIVECLRDIRAAELKFKHGMWETEIVSPACGLRQGSAVSPMIFRLLLEDMPEEISPKWEAQQLGVVFDGRRIFMVCWADDMWLFATCTQALETMIADIRKATLRRTGLALRSHAAASDGKCKTWLA